MTGHHRTLRLFCLATDINAARAIVDTLSDTDPGSFNLRVVARRETLPAGLPEARLRECSGIVEAARRGMFMGSIGGVITGIVAAMELSVSLLPACALVAGGGIIGTVFGAWTAAMMGIEEPHSTLRPYQTAIESGQVLVLADVAPEQVTAVEHLIRQRHPATRIDAEANPG